MSMGFQILRKAGIIPGRCRRIAAEIDGMVDRVADARTILTTLRRAMSRHRKPGLAWEAARESLMKRSRKARMESAHEDW